MTIRVTCEYCGKTLKARDDYAGRKTKCPGCGEPLTVPDVVYDAEEVGNEDGAAPADDEYVDSFDEEDYGYEDDHVEDSYEADDDRRPCRACGEMIRSSAAKCRFCGEVFDRSIKARGRRKGPMSRDDREELRQFRKEMHGLGGFWIFIGCVALLVGIGLMSMGNNVNREIGPAFGAFILIVGIVWLSLGVMTCLKHMWAVWTGLVLSCISLLGNILDLPNGVCGIVIMIGVIFQAKRCIGRAKLLNEAGIPLTKQA